MEAKPHVLPLVLFINALVITARALSCYNCVDCPHVLYPYPKCTTATDASKCLSFWQLRDTTVHLGNGKETVTKPLEPSLVRKCGVCSAQDRAVDCFDCAKNDCNNQPYQAYSGKNDHTPDNITKEEAGKRPGEAEKVSPPPVPPMPPRFQCTQCINCQKSDAKVTMVECNVSSCAMYVHSLAGNVMACGDCFSVYYDWGNASVIPYQRGPDKGDGVGGCVECHNSNCNHNLAKNIFETKTGAGSGVDDGNVALVVGMLSLVFTL